MQLLIKHGYLPTIMPEASFFLFCRQVMRDGLPIMGCCQWMAGAIQYDVIYTHNHHNHMEESELFMILVSSCLLGNNVKYSGGNNGHELLMKYRQYLTAVCPECLGELPIPRPPAELQGGDGHAVLAGRARVCNKEGLDVTGNFRQGARLALELAKKHGVRVAILKANSPSCGNVQIYNGKFDGGKITGVGVTAALLMENGVKVYSEKDIDEALLKRLIEENEENKE